MEQVRSTRRAGMRMWLPALVGSGLAVWLLLIGTSAVSSPWDGSPSAKPRPSPTASATTPAEPDLSVGVPLPPPARSVRVVVLDKKRWSGDDWLCGSSAGKYTCNVPIETPGAEPVVSDGAPEGQDATAKDELIASLRAALKSKDGSDSGAAWATWTGTLVAALSFGWLVYTQREHIARRRRPVVDPDAA